MTYKRIEFGPHAARRLKQRNIRRWEVRWLLARGERTKEETRPGAEQRWGCAGLLGKRPAKVIFVEDARRILLVTIEWIGDPPGQPE